MQLRIIQWNIRVGSDTQAIAELISGKIRKPTVVHLQEVTEKAFSVLSFTLQADGESFSLRLRRPGNHEGRNRRMGVASFVWGGELVSESVVSRSVFPERSLATEVRVGASVVRCLNFHSLTGVDYKKAKSSNFASVADFLAESELDFFACDANEPKLDGLGGDDIEFFNNRDGGRCAALIFGATPVHHLRDALKTNILESGQAPGGSPLAVSHVVAGQARRYDHIYHANHWRVLGVSYEYEAATRASSDHAIVIADFGRVTGQRA